MQEQPDLKRFPTLQAEVGDWKYYVTTMPFYEVARRVQPASDLVNPPNMSSWIQREVMPSRANQIADYLIGQDQRFFPSIVVGVYLGEPTWYEINVQENSILGTPYLDPRFQYSLGILELDGNERLYAIDGQHRVAGIREALKRLTVNEDLETYNRLANEDLSMVFVAANIDLEGHLERVRRLFTTLNKQAKPVSLPETIALDEDDSAAIVTRWLAINYSGLNRSVRDPDAADEHKGLIQLGRRNEIQPRNRHSITNIVTLYRFIAKAFQPELQSLKARYRQNRPPEAELTSLYDDAVGVWELIAENDSAIRGVLGSDPEEERASAHRGTHGGHLLFRPVGLQAFAGALGMLRTRDIPTERAVVSLCSLPKDIAEPPWRYVLWNPNTRRMINSNSAVAEALLLHMLGESPRSARYDLRTRYDDLLRDDPEYNLDNLPVVGLAD